MAFKLRDVIKKSKGGMIGVTVDGKQKWFEEDAFMDMFEKEGTKEVLIDAIKHGRSPEKKKTKEIQETETPDLKPKADISETRDQGWDESEPEPVYEKNVAEKIPPKPAEKPAEGPAQQTPMDEIESRAKPSPYGREEAVEAITPQNFPVFEKRARERFRNHLKRYAWTKTLHPKDAAKRKIEANEEKWFKEFAGSKGRSGMQYALMDDYKRDKDPEMRQFLYDWDRFYTQNKEAVYDLTNKKFFMAQEKEKQERYDFERELDAKRDEMNEITKKANEEAKKYSPENRVKDMKAIAKAKRNLADAKQEGDKDAERAYAEEVKLLEDRLGIKSEMDTPQEEKTEAAPEKKSKGKYGLVNEDKMIKRLKEKGYSDEKIDATLKAYAARGNA